MLKHWTVKLKRKTLHKIESKKSIERVLKSTRAKEVTEDNGNNKTHGKEGEEEDEEE